MSSDLRLAGKVALVTGAGGRHGIGRAIAVRLASEGADVAVNDRSPRPRADSDWGGLPDLVREIEAMGRAALAVTADVSRASEVEAMVAATVERFGRVDIAVHNAGAPAGPDRVPLVELEESVWDQVQAVNAKGTFLCCRAVARAMIAAGGGGRIINMSSLAGKTGVGRFAAYCASKFAVRGLTQALASELGEHGITVNALCPGVIDTERWTEIAAALAPEGVSGEQHQQATYQAAIERTPIGRLVTAAEVAATAAFLASDDAAHLTGLSVPLSGGSFME